MGSRIEYARDAAVFQESLLDFYELVLEFEETRADAMAFGDEEQHERAVEEYDKAEATLDQARGQLDEVEPPTASSTWTPSTTPT